jgi:general stress protein YciG
MNTKQLALVEQKNQTFLENAQKEEKKYEKQIPREFYKEFRKAEVDINEEVNLAIDGGIGRHVVRMYDILTKDGKIPPRSARDITVWRFMKQFNRSKRHIERYITDVEAKDKAHATSARKGAANRKAEEERLLLEKAKEKHLEAVVNGEDGGDTNFLNHSREYMKENGRKGGTSPKTKDEKAEKAVEHYMIDENIAQEVLIELPAKSEFADKIRKFWEAPWFKAYLRINTKGKIIDVENNDITPAQAQRQAEGKERKLEKAIIQTT